MSNRVYSSDFKDKSEKIWDNKSNFLEENFYSIFISSKKIQNFGWTIFFLINLILTFILFLIADPLNSNSYSINNKSITYSNFLFISIISILISFIFCFFSLLFLWFNPGTYIRFAMQFIIVTSIGLILFLTILTLIFFFIFGFIFFIIAFIILYKMYKKIDFSASLLQTSAFILYKFPSLFFFNLFMLLIQLGLSFLFSSGIILSYYLNIHYTIYIYLIFSYFCIIQTLSYVTYSTCAGVASSWYFLNESPFEIKFPFWLSFWRSIGPNFGPCALAGFLEGISSAFRWFEKYGNTATCGLQGCISCICLCMCKCCITSLNFLTRAINRYSLIYSTMFGVPISDAIERWSELSTNKIIDQVVNSSLINTTFTFYSFCISGISTALAAIIGTKKFGYNSDEYHFMLYLTPFIAFTGFNLISKPLTVLSDTIFVGFAEYPIRLQTGANLIYQLFDQESKKLFDEEMKKSNEEENVDEKKKKFIFC